MPASETAAIRMKSWARVKNAANVEANGFGAPEIGSAAVPVPASDYPINIVHDRDQYSYGAWLGREQVGYLSYRLVGGRVALWSTAVLPTYRKRGIATELIARALDDIRASGKTVTIICPIVREMINHYPQYEDLVDKAHPGVRPHAGSNVLRHRQH